MIEGFPSVQFIRTKRKSLINLSAETAQIILSIFTKFQGKEKSPKQLVELLTFQLILFAVKIKTIKLLKVFNYKNFKRF